MFKFFFEDDTYIEGIDPTLDIIPFLKYLEILDSNNNINEIKKQDTDEQILQKILFIYIVKKDKNSDESFRWIKRAYKGIDFIKDILDDNMNACFRQADLYNQDSSLMEEWWDRIYSYSRDRAEKNFQKIGREGEKLSYKYEEHRVNAKPIKEYILNTSAGYDLLSKFSHNSNDKLMIEIKASTKTINKAEAYITRNEYDMATRHNNYVFHFWLLTERKLAILDRGLVLDNAPNNINEGIWEKFKVPFLTFKDKFTHVNIGDLSH
tara:strand:+ start:476 stop:1270 length:795 start_codon:yes stop_codon:yes gene_type:complete